MPAPIIAAGMKAAAKPLLKKAAGAVAKKAAANAAGRVADKVVPPKANKGVRIKKKAAKALDRFATKQEGKAAKLQGKSANMSKKAENARTGLGRAVKKEVSRVIGDVARGKISKAKSARSSAEKIRKAKDGTKLPKKGGKYDPKKEAMKKGLEAKIKKAKGTPAAKPLVEKYRKLTGSK